MPSFKVVVVKGKTTDSVRCCAAGATAAGDAGGAGVVRGGVVVRLGGCKINK